MQAIASLINDDPYLRLPKEQRIADRIRRRELFRPKFVVEIAEPEPVVEPPPAEIVPEIVPEEKPLWFSVEEDLGPINPRAVRIDDIICVVSQHYGVTKIDILSARRTANVVRPRQVCAYLAKKLTPKSLPEIGRRLGNRDHTTVLASIRKITRLLSTEEGLTDRVNILAYQVLNAR